MVDRETAWVVVVFLKERVKDKGEEINGSRVGVLFILRLGIIIAEPLTN